MVGGGEGYHPQVRPHRALAKGLIDGDISIAIHVDRYLDASGKACLADGCHRVAARPLLLLARWLAVFAR